MVRHVGHGVRILYLNCAGTRFKEREEMPKTKKAVKAAEPRNAEAAAPEIATAVKAKKAKAAKPKAVKPKKAKAAKPKAAKAAKPKVAKSAKPKAKKAAKPKVAKSAKPKAKKVPSAAGENTAQLLSSEVVFEGPLFRVVRDRLIEPGGREGVRDVVRHHGSVVILAIDNTKNKKNPWIVIERQYRHAAGQFLWELPAGKLDPGENALQGAQRELEEETGYRAKKWKPLVEYYPSPGFLGESMKVFVAEDLVAGDAHPEDDERIEFRLVKLSQVIKLIEKGAILVGKTLTSVLLFARKMAGKHGK
jgi:ADP-ribose pyrophosphatase